MVSSSNAPIALFVYNRPAHTRRTLESLSRNRGAEQSKLYIFADGLKDNASEQDAVKIESVRRLLREKEWCQEIEISEFDQNCGLAQSIIHGIDEVLKVHDRVIVLEDDIETSPGFLCYMNDALEMYEEQERVMQVSGFMVRNLLSAPQTGFLRVSTSWGWGTWQRAWKNFRNDATNLLEEVSQKGRADFDLDGFSFHFEELSRNVSGALETWAVRWYASIFLNNGLCLYPRQSMVRNLGFDGSGTHCHNDKTNKFSKLKMANRTQVLRRPLEEDPKYLRAVQTHYETQLKAWTGKRLRDRVLHRLKKLLAG